MGPPWINSMTRQLNEPLICYISGLVPVLHLKFRRLMMSYWRHGIEKKHKMATEYLWK